MPKFFDKDFFGDPIWPNDFGSDSNKCQDPDVHQYFSHQRRLQNQEPNINLSSDLSPFLESQDHEDLSKSFQVNQQKLLYSNLKHQEITYLEDHKKFIQFEREDLESQERLSESSLSEDSHDRKLIKEAELKFQKQIFDQIYEMPRLSDRESSSLNPSDVQHSYEPYNNFQKGLFGKFCRKYQLRNPKVKIEENKDKIEEQKIISEIIKNNCRLQDETKRMEKMKHVEINIMKKLGISQNKSTQIQKQINQQKCIDLQTINDQKDIKYSFQKLKTPKYKILTEREKEYLVYLSTETTTCEVARRFKISVNNICRWKKGTKRKVGAGRKIVNSDLEQKVIQYVKELIQSGKPFSRKHIQIEAKNLSDDKSFKASKGWFERFYHRNIKIFKKSLDYHFE